MVSVRLELQLGLGLGFIFYVCFTSAYSELDKMVFT